MGQIFDRAEWIAAQLNDGTTLTVVTDVRAVRANLPCVLIPPPRQDFRAKLVEWRLVVFGLGAPDAASWEAIDDQLLILADELPIETADPGVYPLDEGPPVACYVATYTATQP